MAGSTGQMTQGWFPFVGHKADVNGLTRENNTAYLGMGRSYTADTQNSEVTWPLYLDSVTWKFATVYQRETVSAIATLLWDGVSVGTIDMYGASAANTYAEVTGISITSAKAADFTMRAATRNASSTGWRMFLHSHAWIRTGGTPSTPAGTDTPGYTWEWIPWMGSKANTGWSAITQESTSLGGGRLGPSTAQNDEVSTDAWIDSGTVKIPLIHVKSPDAGIYSIQFDGVEKGVVDGYAAAEAQNSYDEVTGVTVAAGAVVAFKLKMATKNASSSAYAGRVHSAKVIRTGA